MHLWLYTQVKRPMLTYGSAVWWSRTQQSGVIRQLGSIQRQAFLNVTGAMGTTPTDALDVLLNLPPLHIFIQGEAMATAHRLLQGQAPITLLKGKEQAKLYERVKADQIMSMPQDRISPRYNFARNFRVEILEKDAWRNGPPIQRESIWYTDGSKTEVGTGAGIYSKAHRTQIQLSLGTYATVFQAEVMAIQHCATEIINQGITGKTIVIYSDSQAALKAVVSAKISSQLVWDCVGALTYAASRNSLTLAWVPGHSGFRGNEKADELARAGASIPMIGPEPFGGVADTYRKAAIEKWRLEKAREWWKKSSGKRQAKLFIKGHSAKFTAELISQRRNDVRMIVGLLTGHCRLRKHMSQLNLADEDICRYCQEEEETAFHVLCQCEGLARTRYLVLGEEKPAAPSYVEGSLSRLLSLIKRAELDKFL